MQLLSRLFRISICSLIGLYVGAYLTWRVLLATPLYEQMWQLRITELFGSWFYLPLVPLLILGSISGQRRWVGILVIPFAFFAWEYGTQFLPNWQLGLNQSVYASEERNELRLMTWNSHVSYDHKNQLGQLLREVQPDIVTLQEASAGMRHRMSEEWIDQYPYQVSSRYGSLLTISRYPLSEPNIDRLLQIGCRCLISSVTWQGQSITLINIHIPRPNVYYAVLRRNLPTITRYDNKNQEHYFTVLFKLLNQIEGPVLLQGDLNTTERQPNYKQLRQLLNDSFAEAGWLMGYTYPHVESRAPSWLIPIIQIDHIMHSDSFVAHAAWTGALSGSDHKYVIADLRLR